MKKLHPTASQKTAATPTKRRHRTTTKTKRNTPIKQLKPSTAYQGPKRTRCRCMAFPVPPRRRPSRPTNPPRKPPALIQLLAAIQHLPELGPPVHPTEYTRADGLLWRNLPSFGHMWADEHKRDNWQDTLASSDPANRAQLQAVHIRKAGIEARLTVADVGGFPLDWGYECVADALERHEAVLDFEVPAAAEWIVVAGKRLYAGAVAGEESWALERRRDHGMKGRAMSLERWAFWERRLEELAERGEATREGAERAVREMKALIRGPNGKE